MYAHEIGQEENQNQKKRERNAQMEMLAAQATLRTEQIFYISFYIIHPPQYITDQNLLLIFFYSPKLVCQNF